MTTSNNRRSKMRFIKIAIVTTALMLLAGSASAADWTTEDAVADGTNSCTKLNQDGICYLKDIAADSSAISIRECATWTVTVYGTAANIMPQSCKDSACASAAVREDLLATALTGDSPNTFVASVAPFEFVRIDWTAGGAAPTVTIKCGR
jgi:hypothetical protein